jgi:hypothetical protein
MQHEPIPIPNASDPRNASLSPALRAFAALITDIAAAGQSPGQTDQSHNSGAADKDTMFKPQALISDPHSTGRLK